MANYQYKMVQIPPNVSVQMKSAKGQEAAVYLQQVVNSHAQEGWEFYRVDGVGVQENPGCFGSAFGQQSVQYLVYVITFRR